MEMTFEISFDLSDEYVYVKTAGHATPEGFDKMITGMINSPQWKPGGKQLIDHRNLNGKNLTSADLQQIGNIVKKYLKLIGFGKCAYLIPDSLGFGLVRMYELMGGEKLHQEMAVFYDMDEAVEWLKS